MSQTSQISFAIPSIHLSVQVYEPRCRVLPFQASTLPWTF
ncbi:unnamed protein product [Rhodiola kirilowii]